MSASLLTMLGVMLGGTGLSYIFDRRSHLAVRVSEGAVVGLAMFAVTGFWLSFFAGLSPTVVGISATIATMPILVFLLPGVRVRASTDVRFAVGEFRGWKDSASRRNLVLSAFFVLIAALFALIFERAIYEKADGLYTGFANNIGDLPFHLQVIASFAWGQNIPPEHPLFAGPRFTYPFLVDFVSAMLVRIGSSLSGAVLVPDIVLGLAFAGIFFAWAVEITKDRLAAAISVLLVIFSGGLGWWLLLRDLRVSEVGLLGLLRNLPHDYTIGSDPGLRWGNAVTALLVPQRSLLFGLPVALIVFRQWWREREHRFSPAPMVAAGFLAGLLPLIHAHTLAVVIMTGASLALIDRRWRSWGVFFVCATAISLPQLLWLMHGTGTNVRSFIGWHFGWDRGEQNVLLFWLRNTGLVIPLLVCSLLWRNDRRLVSPELLRYYLPFGLSFVVSNIVRLAPWIWDNIKVLFYWYIASVPVIALLIARWWRRGGPLRYIAAGCAVAMTFAGALDIWRVLSRSVEFRVFDRNGITLAREITARTRPRAMVLHAPVFNSPILLTGRRSLLGYPGIIWSHGLEYSQREAEIRRLYAGTTDAMQRLRELGIDYVLISPLERSWTNVSDRFFSQFPILVQTGEYRLYSIRP